MSAPARRRRPADAVLRCPALRGALRRPAAGRGLDGTDEHLEPVPLLVRDGVVRRGAPCREAVARSDRPPRRPDAGPRRTARRGAPPDPREPAGATRRGALRDVRGADRGAAPARRRPGRPRPDVHLPPLLPAVHRRGRELRYRAGARPVPVLRRLRARRPASGTSWRSRSGWRSSSSTRCSAGRSPSTRARPARPSPSCRSAPGTRSWTPTRRSRTLAPDVEALIVRGARTGPRPAGLLPGADRPLLRAGRRAAAGVAGVRRRAGGPGAARRVLRRSGSRSRPARAGGSAGGRMPELAFTVVDIAPEPYAAAPNLLARLRVEETTGERVHALALRCQVRIEPQRRRYDDTEERALLDLFGDRTRFAQTLKPFPWLHASTMVAGLHRGHRDRPAAAVHVRLRGRRGTTYLHALRDGEIPLLFLFSGTVFTRGATGFSVAQVPWDPEARYRMPVAVWRDLMEAHFPGTEWMRMRRDTVGGARPLPARPRPDQLGRRRHRAARRRDGPRCGERAMTPPLARLAADAVLYEGYLLYPYRATARRTRCAGSSACSARPARRRPASGRKPDLAVECLLRPGPARREVTVHLRFLQLQRRQAERADGDGGFTPGGRAARRRRRAGPAGTRRSRSSASWAVPLGAAAPRACALPVEVTAARTSRNSRRRRCRPGGWCAAVAAARRGGAGSAAADAARCCGCGSPSANTARPAAAADRGRRPAVAR